MKLRKHTVGKKNVEWVIMLDKKEKIPRCKFCGENLKEGYYFPLDSGFLCFRDISKARKHLKEVFKIRIENETLEV